MPSFNPFTAVTGRNAITLFDIRLENDFIVFRGNEHESSGQLLKGTVVLCLPAPLKIEDVHLRLTGDLRLSWTDARATPSGMTNTKINQSSQILLHRWQPFVGNGASESNTNPAPTKGGVTLPAGNYEWPFEFLLPGDTCESVEGLREASVTYKLKATVARGKLAYDLHAYKRLRVIRTLESSALEFLHAMSVENIWPNKVEYSIVVPQKAVVFGSSIPLETRFTPLLKGLELGDITIKLVEMHDIVAPGSTGGYLTRGHKMEREVGHWKVEMTREDHWQDMIEDTGQEGWVMRTTLDLPRKLSKCMQDVTVHGIKIRHKLKVVVALKNPDGHISELRATLPVTIFISPNMPLDDEGNLVRQIPVGVPTETASTSAPPIYGSHILDELYDDVDLSAIQTPAAQSGVNTPFYAHSRTNSAENVGAAAIPPTAVTPAALSSRLQNMSTDTPSRTLYSPNSTSGRVTPFDPAGTSCPNSAPLSRQASTSGSSGRSTPEHVDFAEMNKVPSYQTAVRTPVRPLSFVDALVLPDYNTATSAPASPTLQDSPDTDPLSLIPEVSNESAISGSLPQRRSSLTRQLSRRLSNGLGISTIFHFGTRAGDLDDRNRLHFFRGQRVV